MDNILSHSATKKPLKYTNENVADLELAALEECKVPKSERKLKQHNPKPQQQQ